MSADRQPGLFDRKPCSFDEAKLIARLRDPVRFVEAVTGETVSPWQKRLLRRLMRPLPPITVPK